MDASTNAKFKVGDRVKAIAFTNCFGKPVAEVSGLVVESVSKHGGVYGVDEYFRLVARHPDRYAQVSMVEGAERFFAFDA